MKEITKGAKVLSRSATLKFAHYLREAIYNDYWIIALVTSHTQARVKTKQLPWGVGKTTFAMWTSYLVNHVPGTYDSLKPDFHNPNNLNDPVVRNNWSIVFDNMVYNIYDCASNFFNPSGVRRKLGIWDDVSATAPSQRGVPTAVYKFKGFATTARPEIACLLMTASNRNEISAPLRSLVLIEVIVAQRGIYEVQKVEFHKNFKNPERDIAKLSYMEEGEFPQLPNGIERRYEGWRKREKRRLFPNMTKELRKFTRVKDSLSFEPTSIEGRVVKSGSRYFVQLPKGLGEGLHLKDVKINIPKEVTKEIE